MFNKAERLNRELLDMVKRGFVAMPQGADPSLGAGPVAGGGMLTQAQAAPMGGTPPMDPAAMGAPVDPATGMPMDPAAMGGMPPPGDPAAGGMPPGDPAAMGAPADPAAGAMPPPDAMPPPMGQIILTPEEFINVIAAITGGKVSGGGAEGAPGAAKPKSGKANLEAKIDQLLQMMGGAGAPPAPAM